MHIGFHQNTNRVLPLHSRYCRIPTLHKRLPLELAGFCRLGIAASRRALVTTANRKCPVLQDTVRLPRDSPLYSRWAFPTKSKGAELLMIFSPRRITSLTGHLTLSQWLSNLSVHQSYRKIPKPQPAQPQPRVSGLRGLTEGQEFAIPSKFSGAAEAADPGTTL